MRQACARLCHSSIGVPDVSEHWRRQQRAPGLFCGWSGKQESLRGPEGAMDGRRNVYRRSGRYGLSLATKAKDGNSGSRIREQKQVFTQ